MAKQDTSSDKNVTRIKASGSTKSNKKTVTETKKRSVKNAAPNDEAATNFVKGFFGYFVGAWKELRQVHWPDRKSTWSLTLAVLLFSAFFVVFILLLDAGFKFIFEIILK